MGGRGPVWEQEAARARQCQRPGARGGGPGGRAQVGAEIHAGAAPRGPPHSPPPQAGHPAPRLAGRRRAPPLKQRVPGHGGRRAQRGPGCGQRRTAIGRGPPPVGYTDTGRDTREHARMHTETTPTETGHTEGERPERKQTQADGQNTGREGTCVNHLLAIQPQRLSHWEGPQLKPSNQPPTDTLQTRHCLSISSRRELTTLQGSQSSL